MRVENYRQTVDELESAGVRCCVLRDRIQPGIELRDLDLLIHPDDLDNAEDRLRSLGFIVRRPLSRSLYKQTMMLVDGAATLHLDIHVQVVQDGLIYMDVDRLMSNLTRADDCWVPCPEHQLIHLIVHNILGKGHLQSKHLDRIIELAAGELDADVLSTALSDFGLQQLVSPVIQNPSRYADPGPESDRLRSRIRRRLIWKNRAGWGRLARIWWLQWRYYRGLRRKGTLITLLGPDGSGKSSLAAALTDKIDDVFGQRPPTVYMGPWGQFQLWLTWKIRYRPWAAGTRSWKHLWAEIRTGRLISAPFVILKYAKYHIQSYLGLFVLYIELWWRYIRIYRLLRVGRHVIADRYIHDLQVGGMHIVTRERERAIRLLCRLFPEPDLCICLTNSAEVLFERKAELDVETGRQILEIYERIADSVGAERLKTDQSPEALASHIVRENYQTMLAKMRI